MVALPNFFVLDFLEWVSQKYPKDKLFLDALLDNKKLVMSHYLLILNDYVVT